MPRVVDLPPSDAVRPDGNRLGGWWRETEGDGRVLCELCPRLCHLKPGDRGFCFVRQNIDGEMVLTTYGRSTGFCIDPIEKKPLNHFFPGTSVLSFGTAGCNLGCKFCQNWDISKSREVERLSESATPEMIAEAAVQLGCRSVAYTYNDPVIWAEYAIDCARACRQRGIQSVAVTAGYITPAARGPFFHEMDAANVDLKAFTEEFYHKITYSHLQPVLETLEWLKHESDVWFEITNLIIPQANDSHDELRQMCDFVLDRIGDEVPIHFTAFHPDFRMTDRPNTPPETLLAAYEIAQRQGIRFVYVGNVHDVQHQSTYCPSCKRLLIERDWHQLGVYDLAQNQCGHCGETIAGRFETRPGDWGRRRLPVRIADYAPGPPESLNSVNQGTRTMQTIEPASDARPELTASQGSTIHRAACEIVAATISGAPLTLSDPELADAAGATVMGSFVTLKRQGRLRACCGTLGKPMKLFDALSHAAARTAAEDVRLPPISPSELPYLELEVSLLHSFEPMAADGVERVEHVEIGRHGLAIQRGNASGLLLPVVATENNFDAETFLRQVCSKAGLPTTAWHDDDARIQTFEATVISDEFDPDVVAQLSDPAAPIPPQDEMPRFVEHCRANIQAHMYGATPNYYLVGAADGTISGVILVVRVPDRDRSNQFAQISPRPGIPLQATLLELTRQAGVWLAAESMTPTDKLDLDLVILADPAMHGTVSAPDLRGFTPGQRLLQVNQYTRTAWIVDAELSGERQLECVAREARVTSASSASVLSFAAVCSSPSLSIANVPRAQKGAAIRAAAVAGSFYPSDPAELAQQLDELMPASSTPRTVPAALVPHAGLRYSGRIAAAVFAQLAIPDTVIILGPKHTRLGVEWSVAPHESWSIPGAQIPSDAELARQLAAAIPHLELDAAAHQNEHAIEVELPFLARLAPHARVVGIAMGGGDLTQCREFATGLAGVIRSRPNPPLLLISSDMNHFANDDENRRLDRLALDALARFDPEDLYRTVTGHHISMCGVLPAVVVLETLRQLEQLSWAEEVAYSTSADEGGDKNRVVGYAGMLFGNPSSK